MKKTNNHPFTGYKLSQINLKSRQIIEDKQKTKNITGLAVRTKLVAGSDAPFPLNIISNNPLFGSEGTLQKMFHIVSG